MSGGTFSKDARPSDAGTYVDFVAAQAAVVPPSIGGTVCVGFTHNWGPVKTPELLASWPQFLAMFRGDPSNPTSGYNAVYQAFAGDDDFGGAGGVLAYRMAGSDIAAATLTLQNSTPADALTLSALYEGSLGNDLSVTVQDYAADSSKDQLIVYLGTTAVETYTYANTDVADLAAQINNGSTWLTAESLISGVALGTVTSTALTGGDDGATLASGDYTDALDDLSTQRFGVLVFENLIDTDITAAVLAWVQAQNAAGYRFTWQVGTDIDSNLSDSLDLAASLNDGDVLCVGMGHVVDSALLDSNGNPTTLSPAQMAPRMAGSRAARGERYSLTFAKYGSLKLYNGATASEVAQAKAGGLMVLDRMSDLGATVRVANGVTTYTTTTDPAKPKAIYSVPKFMAVMENFQNDLQLWADENVIGKTTVDNDTRTAVLGRINEMLRQREQLGSVQPGWKAYVDPTPPASDSDDFVAFVIVAKFGRSTEQVYFTAMVS